MKKKWKIDELPTTVNESQFINLEEGKLKNQFIFGEDPMGTAKNLVCMAGWISDFVFLQDSFMTKTAKKTDLVLPHLSLVNQEEAIQIPKRCYRILSPYSSLKSKSFLPNNSRTY